MTGHDYDCSWCLGTRIDPDGTGKPCLCVAFLEPSTVEETSTLEELEGEVLGMSGHPEDVILIPSTAAQRGGG